MIQSSVNLGAHPPSCPLSVKASTGAPEAMGVSATLPPEVLTCSVHNESEPGISLAVLVPPSLFSMDGKSL